MFAEEGFEELLELANVTEGDLELMNVKLGHRRRILALLDKMPSRTGPVRNEDIACAAQVGQERTLCNAGEDAVVGEPGHGEPGCPDHAIGEGVGEHLGSKGNPVSAALVNGGDPSNDRKRTFVDQDPVVNVLPLCQICLDKEEIRCYLCGEKKSAKVQFSYSQIRKYPECKAGHGDIACNFLVGEKYLQGLKNSEGKARAPDVNKAKGYLERAAKAGHSRARALLRGLLKKQQGQKNEFPVDGTGVFRARAESSHGFTVD
eukprot:g70530.t1